MPTCDFLTYLVNLGFNKVMHNKAMYNAFRLL